MKHLIVFVFFLQFIFSHKLQSQEYADFPILVTLTTRSEYNKRVADHFFRDYQEKINARYRTTFQALIKFHPRVRESGEITIVNISETDTIKSLDVDIKMVIHNMVTDEKFDWKKTFSVTGINLQAALKDSFETKMLNNEELFDDLVQTINTYIHSEYHLNCNKYIEAAKQAYGNKKINWAIAILMGISHESSCHSAANILLVEYYSEYLNNLCQFDFDKWSKTNTNTSIDTNVLNRFKFVHHSAPCADSVLKIIDTIEHADPDVVKLNAESLSTLKKIKSNLSNDLDDEKYNTILSELRYTK